MPVVEHVLVRKAIQYTGSNGAEVAAFVNSGIVSDNGSILEMGDPSAGWVGLTMHVGDWFEDMYNTVWPAADFPDRHISKADVLRDTNNNAAVAALQAAQSTQAGHISTLQGSNASLAASVAALGNKPGRADIVSISVPILILGGTADRPITWNRPFSNVGYDLSYAFDASTIGRISCSIVPGTKTTTGVTIRVSAGLAVSVLGVVHVFAIGP